MTSEKTLSQRVQAANNNAPEKFESHIKKAAEVISKSIHNPEVFEWKRHKAFYFLWIKLSDAKMVRRFTEEDLSIPRYSAPNPLSNEEIRFIIRKTLKALRKEFNEHNIRADVDPESIPENSNYSNERFVVTLTAPI